MFILSRTSQDNEYVVWGARENGSFRVQRTILIKGGANVLDKTVMKTPNGVVTEVSDEDWKELENHVAFKKHMERGFYEVMKEEKSANEAKKKQGKKDGGAQLTAQDFEERGQKAPVVNTDE